ncbi:virulence factor MVIN family protein [Caballeronia temeraria]|uniref:Virulence factor MVIN family protein n=1 Tax=Caballeronia temeraria TaxID=1777137 RepID=A0A158A331_9BURK|nr:lipid II flippase MurJ [Caballeronia temeraria]SAK52232.1 virulence factor MVIN family protein [Caballeronia temeraria]
MLTATVQSLRERLLGVHQDHKRIARSAFVLLLFVLAGKLIGASKEMAIAYRYGVSGTVDAYQLALTIVTWLPATITNQLSVLLVPALVALRNDKTRQNQLLSELEGAGLAIGIVVSLMLYFFWPHMVGFFSGTLSEATREMCRQMVVGMTPVGVLAFTICISAARLQASEKHINTLLECVPAIALLVFVLGARDNSSSMPLIVGTTIGIVIQALWLRILAKRADGVRALPRLSVRAPHWPGMTRSLGMLLIGSVVANLWLPVDQYFMAHMGDGAIATLGYANRLLSLLVSMGAIAISRATLPILSEILHRGDHARARSTARKWSFVMLGVGTAGAALAYVLAPFAIKLLFQKGAFTSEDTIAVTSLFRCGLSQIPFSFGMCVLIQSFASEARYRAITVISVLGFATKLAATAVLIRFFGAQGVLLGTGVGAASVFICYFFLTNFAPVPAAPRSDSA